MLQTVLNKRANTRRNGKKKINKKKQINNKQYGSVKKNQTKQEKVYLSSDLERP